MKFICAGPFIAVYQKQIEKKKWFGFFFFVSLFNGTSTLFRLFNGKAILLEEQ